MKDRHPMDIHVGTRLREARRHCGLTQFDLAEALAMPHHELLDYELGCAAIPAARLWQFSEFLDVPVIYFFRGFPDPAVSRA